MAMNSSKMDEQIAHMSKAQTIFRLFSYMKGFKKELILVAIAMVFSIAISLLNPLLIQEAIDKYLPKEDMNGLLKLGIFTVAINIIFVITVKIRMYYMSVVANSILRNLRQELYEHIQTLSFTFFDGRPTGKILARIVGDINSLRRVLSSAVTNFIPGIFTVIGVIAIMLWKNVILGALCLTTFPFMVVGLIGINVICHSRWQLFRKKSSNLNAYVHEDISGISVVQGFVAEEENAKVFDGLVEEHKHSFIRAVRLGDTFGPIIEICWGLSTMFLYWGGTKLLGIGSVSVGSLAMYGIYVGMLWEPVANIAQFYNQVITSISCAERVFEVIDTKAEIADKKDAFELPEIKGQVAFKNVSFTYDAGTENETKVLDNVSFSVKEGECIALVGPTGAGKTTIVNLLSRFYDIQNGQILVDGIDVRDVTVQSLRKQMGVMTQENFVFSGTIADNIRYGKLDATMDEVINAAKAVNAHDFIMGMKNGYDTDLKEVGTGLSIGQRQLIAFARTMISMPKILILDEATSSIDTKTEIAVQKGIEGLLKNRTSFVIAHRLSTIQNADRIFVVDDKGIVESGSPKELMEKRGQYYNLYMAQFAEIT